MRSPLLVTCKRPQALAPFPTLSPNCASFSEGSNQQGDDLRPSKTSRQQRTAGRLHAMKRDPHFHDSVFRVAWVATFQQVCDDALVLLRDVTLDVGDSRLNVLSSRDHCPAPRSHADTPHPRVTKMCATTQDVLNLWVRR